MDESKEKPDLLRPEDVPRLLPSGLVVSSPVVSGDDGGWQGLVLQHYRNPSHLVELPPVRDHIVVVHMGGPLLIDEKRDGGRRVRCWADKGQVTLTPSGHSVYRDLKGRADALVIHLRPSLVSEVAEAVYGVDAAGVSICPRLGVPDSTTFDLGQLLLAEAATADVGTDLVADLLSRALSAHLLRSHSSLTQRQPERPPSMPNGRLRQVIQFMQVHLDRPLPLAQLAALGGLSPSQFARSFREATGQPPHQYLLTLRMKRARELLERSNCSILEVALQCGFEYPTHFAAVFRKYMGLNPRAWRIARRF